MFRATCPVTMLLKNCETTLHETFHSVTAPQQSRRTLMEVLLADMEN